VIAVLGPGAVGANLAARLSASGHDVVCVARPRTAEGIRRDGITLTAPDRSIVAHPRAADELSESTELLLVTVKAQHLRLALSRVGHAALADGVVMPLLNGLEHPAALRALLGRPVAPGSVSRFSGELETEGKVVQRSPSMLVTVARGDAARAALEKAVEALRGAGIEVEVGADERDVLWGKAARLGALAAATAASGMTVGELRDDPEWRALLEAGIAEGCAVAEADGVPQQPADHWAIIVEMPFDASTSTAADVAAGRPSELDAITGSVVRAGRRCGVPTPVLSDLVERCRQP
jgi:2-dehydropantoate 2-reductase